MPTENENQSVQISGVPPPTACSVRTRDAIASIRKRRCPLCGGEWRADVMPNDLGDSIPELGLQECIFCGAIWNTNEDAAGEELRGGCGLFVRGPTCTPNPKIDGRGTL